MHHDNVPSTLLIEFRGERVTIVYEIHRPGMESISFWFEDGRPWPEDLRDEEVGAIREAVERDACEGSSGG
jgi:hypothetical protein